VPKLWVIMEVVAVLFRAVYVLAWGAPSPWRGQLPGYGVHATTSQAQWLGLT